MKHEKKFYEALESIFVGAPIEGEGGYVNLLKVKEKYYRQVVDNLKSEIKNDEIITESFKEDFYNLLYNFFEKYFSECGSVYFAKTANWQKVYEKVYSDNKDVVLFWKTNMLYYVKSDILFRSIYIKSLDTTDNQNYVFFFDVGDLKQKQNNEKKELVFSYKETKTETVIGVHDDTTGDKTFILTVAYSERGRKTDIGAISSSSGVKGEIIEKAINTFKKQTTVDFFINKNAKAFLEEQLDIFLHQLLLDENSEFTQERLTQIKAVKIYAKKLIGFIAQFEDELVKIWNKPKFVRNSNYVLSFKTLKNLVNSTVYEKYKKIYWEYIFSNNNCKNDIIEAIREVFKRPLQHLYVGDCTFNINKTVTFKYINFYKNDKDGIKGFQKLIGKKDIDKFASFILDKGERIDGFISDYNNELKYKDTISVDDIYIDTKFLTYDEKIELLSEISNNNALDETIDGCIVKSDNYQFLQTANKYKNTVKLVYIDPPFNTNTEGFAFIDGFKDSSWLTQMRDRYEYLYNKFMSENSSMYVHGDHHCNYYMRLLLDEICGNDNFGREIIWNTSPAISGLKAGPKVKNYIRQHDTILYYEKGNPTFNKLFREYQNPENNLEKIGWLDMYQDDDKKPYLFKYDNNSNIVKIDCSDVKVMALGDVWNDVFSMMYTQNMTRENWGKSNTQKPENLLRRFIQVSSNPGDRVMDIFVGSGTTIAVAHKLGRKWIGVEAGPFVEDIVIKRMKSVVFGDFRAKLSEDLNWQGGGFFKYYSLEQYEDALDNAIYTDNGELYSNDVCGQYVFFADKKLSDVLEVNNKQINVDLYKLYDDIDLPESISMLYGKAIEKITLDTVKLKDINEPIKYNTEVMTDEEKIAFIKMLKPFIWWGNE